MIYGAAVITVRSAFRIDDQCRSQSLEERLLLIPGGQTNLRCSEIRHPLSPVKRIIQKYG